MRLGAKKKLDLVLGGLLLFLLKIPVMTAGRILRRDHDPRPRGEVLFIKMQGGGSLVLALGALYGIRKTYPDIRISLLTTLAVAPFARTFGLFDRIVAINDKNAPLLLGSALNAIFALRGVDTVVDLEVYSRLSTVFSLLTLARNRAGFYLDSAYWRRDIHTHLIFLNRFSPVREFYNQVALLLKAAPAEDEEVKTRLSLNLEALDIPSLKEPFIAIGHGCSEMGRERMLSPKEWTMAFEALGLLGNKTVVFLGSDKDRLQADDIISAFKEKSCDIQSFNLCGKLTLAGSVKVIELSERFIGIDSALLHYARALKKDTISFWGPTDPLTRLSPVEGVKTVAYYKKALCSPCIHVAEEPPCKGDNICIKNLFNECASSVDTKNVTVQSRLK